MRLVVLGPQGAGKGTQAGRIGEKYGIPLVATGDIFRAAMKSESDLGKRVRAYVEEGRLVPDELTIEVVSEQLSSDDYAEGFLLDGFPRSLKQAQALDDILAANGLELDAALLIDVPEDVSLRRLNARRVCTQCGWNYSVDNPPARNWTCDICGGEVETRQDDVDEQTVRARLKAYHEQLGPLRDYYRERGLLRDIDGSGSPDEVFAKIVSSL